MCTWRVGYRTFRIKSQDLVKFGGHISRGIVDITFFICHVTWYVLVMNRLCGFANSILSSEATSLSSLVAIGLVELEIQCFFICHVISWPRDWRATWVCWWWFFALTHQVLQSVTDCYYKVGQVLQRVTNFIIKCIRHCKVWQLL